MPARDNAAQIRGDMESMGLAVDDATLKQSVAVVQREREYCHIADG